jgi:exosome complex component RRP42
MISNKKTIANLAAKGERLDNRPLTEYRGPISVDVNITKMAEGSARVQIGDTVVLAGVKLALEKPYSDTPTEGGLMVNAELTPLSSPEYFPGPPQMKAIELARVTDRGIRESHAIDVHKLCIKDGEQAWFVTVDIVTINDAGNLFDAASLAAIAALKNTTFREFNPDNGVVDYKSTTKDALPVAKEPLSITVHKINGVLMVDPTLEEEEASDARLTITSDSKGVISAMQKGGNTPLSADEVNKIAEIALEKAAFLRSKLGEGTA